MIWQRSCYEFFYTFPISASVLYLAGVLVEPSGDPALLRTGLLVSPHDHLFFGKALLTCLRSYSGRHPAEDSSHPRPAGLNSPHYYSYMALRPVGNYVSPASTDQRTT